MTAFSMANMALFGSGWQAIKSFYQELKMKVVARGNAAGFVFRWNLGIQLKIGHQHNYGIII